MDQHPQKVAVISGAFGYVGKTVAAALAQEGFTLSLLSYTSSAEVIEATMRELPGSGHQVYSCDLRDGAALEEVFDTIERTQGPLTLALHAAGQKPDRKKLLLTTADELQAQFENTTLASFNFLTCAGRRLKQHGGGVLIGLTTIGVVVPEATKSLGAYIPAKYAVQGILTMLRDELASAHVAVYSIAPGFMPGGMNRDIPKAFVGMLEAQTPDNKLASAEDIAATVVALANHTLTPDGLTITIAPEYSR
jgi:NAD(P)-dependent dehydrogenase (short-subunit alcohol dehydrogenase family)